MYKIINGNGSVLRFFFDIVAMIFLCCSNCNPYIMAIGYEKKVYFFFYGYFLLRLIQSLFMSSKIQYLDIIRLFLFIYMALLPYLLDNGVYSNRYLHLSGIILYPVIYKYVFRTREIIVSNYILLIIMSVISASTLRALMVNPYAARTAESSALLLKHGVGSYTFIYSMSLVLIILFCDLLMNRRKGWLFLVEICLFIFNSLIVLKSNFVTATLIIFFGCLVTFLLKNVKILKEYKRYIYMIVFSFLAVFFDYVIYGISSLFFSILPFEGRWGALISNQSESILKILMDEFLLDRAPTIRSSLEAIAQNPLLGVVFSGESFGQHSMFFDSLAVWGIPIGGLYIYLFLEPFFSRLNGISRSYSLPLFMGVVVLVVFNNVDPSCIYVAYIVGLFFIDHSVMSSRIVKLLPTVETKKEGVE